MEKWDHVLKLEPHPRSMTQVYSHTWLTFLLFSTILVVETKEYLK